MSGNELVIHFGNLRDRACDIFVTSPVGEESGTFELPFDDAQLEAIDQQFELFAALRPGDPAEFRPKYIGRLLFDALFHSRVLLLYRTTRLFLKPQQMLVIIKLNPRGIGFDILHKLAWELLYDTDTQEHLATAERGAVVRQLTVPEKAEEAEQQSGATAILVAGSSPGGKIPVLEVEDHFTAIQSIVGSKAIRSDGGSRRALRQALSTMGSNVQVLHLFAHGMVHPNKGGCLLLEGSKPGETDPISADDLAKLIHEHHPYPEKLGLIFLCACSGADNPDDSSQRLGIAYAGLASALIRKGFPNVIGMSHPIENHTATQFAQSFYNEVYNNDQDIALSISKARQEIYDDDSLEWRKPTLYSLAQVRLPNINWPFFKKLWTVIALAVLYLSVTIFSQMQGGDLGLPTIEKNRYSAAVYGLILCTPLYLILLWLTIYYVRCSTGKHWYSRLPEPWALTWNFAHPSTHWYQGVAFFFFFVLTTYAQGAFFDKFLGGTLYFYPKSCPVVEEPRNDHEDMLQNRLTHINKRLDQQAAYNIDLARELNVVLPGVNIDLEDLEKALQEEEKCYNPLTKGWRDHFEPSSLIVPGHPIFSSSHDYVYGEGRIDFFPIIETWFFTLEMIIGSCLLLYLIRLLFRRNPSSRAVRRT